MQHIMYTFSGYCKTVIRFAAINAWRKRSRRRQKEISLEYLTAFSFTFSGITHRGKSGKCTDAAGVPPGIKSAGLYSFCTKKWGFFHMGNPNLLPYETIVRATSGEPEAVDECLCEIK